MADDTREYDTDPTVDAGTTTDSGSGDTSGPKNWWEAIVDWFSNVLGNDDDQAGTDGPHDATPVVDNPPDPGDDEHAGTPGPTDTASAAGVPVAPVNATPVPADSPTESADGPSEETANERVEEIVFTEEEEESEVILGDPNAYNLFIQSLRTGGQNSPEGPEIGPDNRSPVEIELERQETDEVVRDQERLERVLELMDELRHEEPEAE